MLPLSQLPPSGVVGPYIYVLGSLNTRLWNHHFLVCAPSSDSMRKCKKVLLIFNVLTHIQYNSFIINNPLECLEVEFYAYCMFYLPKNSI